MWKCSNNDKGICLLEIADECKYNNTMCLINNFTDYLLMKILKKEGLD